MVYVFEVVVILSNQAASNVSSREKDEPSINVVAAQLARPNVGVNLKLHQIECEEQEDIEIVDKC